MANPSLLSPRAWVSSRAKFQHQAWNISPEVSGLVQTILYLVEAVGRRESEMFEVVHDALFSQSTPRILHDPRRRFEMPDQIASRLDETDSLGKITLGHLRIALGEESALGRCPDDVKVTWLESELNHQFGVPFPDVTLNVWLSFWIDVQVNHHELPTVSFQHLFECLQDGFRP